MFPRVRHQKNLRKQLRMLPLENLYNCDQPERVSVTEAVALNGGGVVSSDDLVVKDRLRKSGCRRSSPDRVKVSLGGLLEAEPLRTVLVHRVGRVGRVHPDDI